MANARNYCHYFACRRLLSLQRQVAPMRAGAANHLPTTLQVNLDKRTSIASKMPTFSCELGANNLEIPISQPFLHSNVLFSSTMPDVTFAN